MVPQTMGARWTSYGLDISCFILFTLIFGNHGCCTLNSEGLALFQFRAKVDLDPYGALTNWNFNDCDPCRWSGIECMDGKVVMVKLSGYELWGVLARDLGKLAHLRYLDLSKNHLSGAIPPQLGQLKNLEVLDLRDNSLSGILPEELGGLPSLERLLLSNNKFEGSIPVEIGRLRLLSDFLFDDFLSTTAIAAGTHRINRKLGQCCIWQTVSKQPKKLHSFKSFKWSIIRYLNQLPKFKLESESSGNHNNDIYSSQTSSPMPDAISDMHKQVTVVRRILVEQPANVAALPSSVNIEALVPQETLFSLPSRSSGSFRAVPDKNKPGSSHTSGEENKPQQNEQSSDVGNSSRSLKLITGLMSIAAFFLIVAAVVLFIFRSRAAKTIVPRKAGLSGQLQKAFITGVPKLKRDELETACEDFSNITYLNEGVATLYKGTLSSGVEISVASTAIDSIEKWTEEAEFLYRRKVDGLSKVNHKNFINLIGYCEEDEPFMRMMVFEYAPNGQLFDHLHVKQFEHLDWSARMRIIMGIAYCLQNMHDLNPPVAHIDLTSKDIFLTDDYAAKLGDVTFWKELIDNPKNPAEIESEPSQKPPPADVESNLHSFGILMLEIISGKLPYSEEQGDLLNWADHYLDNKSMMSQLIDPTLKCHKDDELAVVCEAIRSCTQQDPRKRPPTKEVVQQLQQALNISPEAATPRLSPLWWAELEILSAEST